MIYKYIKNKLLKNNYKKMKKLLIKMLGNNNQIIMIIIKLLKIKQSIGIMILTNNFS